MMPQEYNNVMTAQPLNKGSRMTFSREFPLAQGWYVANLRFGIHVTTGSGTGPISGAEFDVIKNVFFKTDRGEVICNCPGRALREIAITKSGTVPDFDAFSGGSGSYYVNLPIYFYDPLMIVPEDTLLDTARYQSVTLDVQMGTEADLFASPGSASVHYTLDVDILMTRDVVPEGAGPLYHPTYEVMQPRLASVQTDIDVERSQDMSVKRLLVHAGSDAATGDPFTGAYDSGIINTLSFSDATGYIVRERIARQIAASNRLQYGYQYTRQGVYVLDFVNDGDANSSIFTGDKAQLKVHWENGPVIEAQDQISVLVEGLRALK